MGMAEAENSAPNKPIRINNITTDIAISEILGIVSLRTCTGSYPKG